MGRSITKDEYANAKGIFEKAGLYRFDDRWISFNSCNVFYANNDE